MEAAGRAADAHSVVLSLFGWLPFSFSSAPLPASFLAVRIGISAGRRWRSGRRRRLSHAAMRMRLNNHRVPPAAAAAADLPIGVDSERTLQLRVREGEMLQRAERAPRRRQPAAHTRASQILSVDERARHAARIGTGRQTAVSTWMSAHSSGTAASQSMREQRVAERATLLLTTSCRLVNVAAAGGSTPTSAGLWLRSSCLSVEGRKPRVAEKVFGGNVPDS